MRFCWDKVFCLGQETNKQKCSMKIDISIFCVFSYCTLFFINLTKTVKKNPVKLIKNLICLNPYNEDRKMKPAKHIIIQMSIIHASFVSWSHTFFEISRIWNLYKKSHPRYWRYLIWNKMDLFTWHHIDNICKDLY